MRSSLLILSGILMTVPCFAAETNTPTPTNPTQGRGDNAKDSPTTTDAAGRTPANTNLGSNNKESVPTQGRNESAKETTPVKPGESNTNPPATGNPTQGRGETSKDSSTPKQ